MRDLRPSFRTNEAAFRGALIHVANDQRSGEGCTPARPRVDPHELETFTGQLNLIVNHVAQLQELDTTDVEPLTHGIEVRNVFRDDVRGPSLDREKALANAPGAKPGRLSSAGGTGIRARILARGMKRLLFTFGGRPHTPGTPTDEQ